MPMKKLRNFKCQSCESITERMVQDDIKSIECQCGNEAHRTLSAPKFTNNSCGNNASWSKSHA